MNKVGPQLLISSQSACFMRLATEFRCLSRKPVRVVQQTQRLRSTFTNAAIVLARSSTQATGGNSSHLLKNSGMQQNVIKRFLNQIVEEGAGTHKPSPFQKKVLVWGKMYPSVEKVPERVTRNQMKKAMDKFRVRVSLMMVAATFVSAAIMALIGRKQRNEGQSVTKMTLERRGQSP